MRKISSPANNGHDFTNLIDTNKKQLNCQPFLILLQIRNHFIIYGDDERFYTVAVACTHYYSTYMLLLKRQELLPGS